MEFDIFCHWMKEIGKSGYSSLVIIFIFLISTLQTIAVADNDSISGSCSSGSGCFGNWTVDEFGLPAYDYTKDRANAPRNQALMYGSDDELHWHQLGNNRVNALATSDGFVVLFGQDRGPVFYNSFDPMWRNYSGGYGFIEVDGKVWSTDYRNRPLGMVSTRRFGIGYFETSSKYDGIEVIRSTFAPEGDLPALVSEIKITNTRDTVVDLNHYEYWDVNMHQIALSFVMTGSPAFRTKMKRDEINQLFRETIEYDPAMKRLTAIKSLIKPEKSPSSEVPDDVDHHPADQFLANLHGDINAVFTDQWKIFPLLGKKPKFNRVNVLPSTRAAFQQKNSFIEKSSHHLQPGEQAVLRFAYGYGYGRREIDTVNRQLLAKQPSKEKTIAWWKNRLVSFSGLDNTMGREAIWHSYLLLSSIGYRAYWQRFVVPQGSAYLYIHGADGAPRDQSLFTLPLVYLNPELAREQLRLIMRMTQADTGAIPYSFSGHGKTSGAIIHRFPSDLDLFFFLALSEYLGFSGDRRFLDEHHPFMPPGKLPKGAKGDTVLDHIEIAFRHLVESIGIGENGLIKIGDGDWSDSIVLESSLAGVNLGVEYGNSVRQGESIPNSQMALYVLPRMADAIAELKPELAEAMRSLCQSLDIALSRQWNGNWYNRAILRNIKNKQVVIGADLPHLEASVWPLITRHGSAGTIANLVGSVRKHLDDPNPTGALLLVKGMVWPAVSQLLTWGYTEIDRYDLAWRQLIANSYTRHAEIYPQTWPGTISAPDGLYGADNPGKNGGTWTSPLTPMEAFPVMNNNPDAMWLLGMLRCSGIRSTSVGPFFDLRNGLDTFELSFPVVQLMRRKDRLDGSIMPPVDARRIITFRLPKGTEKAQIVLDDQTKTYPVPENGLIRVPVLFTKNKPCKFRVFLRNP